MPRNSLEIEKYDQLKKLDNIKIIPKSSLKGEKYN